MAEPMSVTQLLATLSKWGVNYKPYLDWSTHNRNHKGPWGPVHGLMVHHTGSDNNDQRALLYNGYDSLPGPLCHFGLSQLGNIHLIGWGRTNHAGKGDPDVLNAVKTEKYGDFPPTDDEATVDGNTHFYGVEIWYSGNHEMTAAQHATLIKLSAAICDHHGWTGKSVIAHGEWQPGKWDPGHTNMPLLREEINKALLKGPNPVAIPVADVPENTDATYKSVWKTDAMRKPSTAVDTENDYYEAETMLRYAAEQAATANKKLDLIMKHLGLI